jgi:CheY-like chemotaxis protein
LLDLMMPVLDGWGFVDVCRQERICPGVPVVVMSAAHALQEITARQKLLNWVTILRRSSGHAERKLP